MRSDVRAAELSSAAHSPEAITGATLYCVATAQRRRDKAMALRQALAIQNRTAR